MTLVSTIGFSYTHHLVFFALWTSPDIKSRCHKKSWDGLPVWAIFKMAAIKIWKSRFVQ